MKQWIGRKPKVFCIGANKTGTTSVEMALKDLGYRMGDQDAAQALLESYGKRQFADIIRFCKSADAFQGAPFSWHYTFMFLEQAFPDARFVLTIRDNEDVWYDSLVRFHTRIFGKNGAVPTEADLRAAKRAKGRTAWDNMNIRHEMIPGDPYNRDMLTAYYRDHNRMVKDYFRFKDNLLVINLKDQGAYQAFCNFIGSKPLYEHFPWENRTN